MAVSGQEVIREAQRPPPFRARGRTGVFAVVLLIAIVAAISFWRSPAPVPDITGTLSSDDVVQIQKILRADMWQQAFPAVSWQTVKSSPRSLYRLATSRIFRMEVLSSSSVQVHIKSRPGDRFYLVQEYRNENGQWEWRIHGQGPTALVAVLRGYRGPGWFGQNIFSDEKTSAVESVFGVAPGAGAGSSAVEPRYHRPISTEAEFSTSLSNRATLRFGR